MSEFLDNLEQFYMRIGRLQVLEYAIPALLKAGRKREEIIDILQISESELDEAMTKE